MRIGELARRTGTTPKALRLYEAQGLLGRVARAGSYRHYSEPDVAQVLLIRQALALGFRLSQLRGLHALDTPQGWAQIASLVAARRAAVAQELQRLQALAQELATLEAQLHACEAHTLPGRCVVPPS